MSQQTRDPDETETARTHRAKLPAESRPSLLWVFPEYGRVTAPEGLHLVGRSETCHTVLKGTKISREHAEISPVGAAFAIRDLGSRNGVSVNGRIVEGATALSPGDVVRLGEWIGVVVTGVEQQTSFSEIAPGLLGGPTLASALEPARKIAEKGLPLVIEGATGTGKERVARALHAWSRRTGEYVGVNCAAIPSDLAEAELFGHTKGAFTGADRARTGYFRQADRGTLLLDEFLELPPKTQAKLLRVLEEWEVQPLGESKPVRVDVLVLAATQEPLSSMVEAGQLRNDLVARLGVITIRLPRLAERREDIAPLFKHFLADQSGAPRAVDAELIEWLCMQRWTQNVRELEWLARAMIALNDDVACLTLEHLPPQLRGSASQRPPAPSLNPVLGEEDDDAMFNQLVRALDENGGVVLRAADALGITRQKAYRILGKRPGFELDQLRKRR